MSRTASALLIALALVVTGCVARSERPLPLWPALHRGTLANGLTYYVLRQPYPLNRAQAWLAVDAGSIQEDEDQRGLAHFVEHMAFNGTRRFPGSDVVDWAERIGMGFGPHVNASTHYDQTIYTLEVPTDDPTHLATALDILRDWAGDITFGADAVERERGVVVEEWRLQRGAGERLASAHLPVIFAGSRYAERHPLGEKAIIEGAPREALTRFYADWYRPDLMAVIVVGDIEPDEVVPAISARFGDLAKREHPRERFDGGVPEPSPEPRVSIVSDKELPRASISIYDLAPHRPELTRSDFRRQVREVLWQIMMSERLGILELREDAPFEDGAVGVDTITRDIDGLIRGAVAKPGRIEDALRGIMTEVVRAERHGFSEAELERAKVRLKRVYDDYEEQFATTQSAVFADEITRNFFEDELMVGPTVEKELALALLPSYTPDEMSQVTAGFGTARRVIEISAPDDETIPTKERVLTILDEVARSDIDPWEEGDDATALVATPPEPGRVVSESRIDAIDTTVWTLSNGIRVFVKPTDFSIDNVVILGSSAGGLSVYDDATYLRARFAEPTLSQGGVGELDPVALARLLTSKEAWAQTLVGETTDGVLAGSSVKDLETILELLWLRVTSPRLDPVAVRTWTKSQTDQLAVRLRSPEARFASEAGDALVQDHLRRKSLVPADLEDIDLAQALTFHQERFGDMSDFTFAIVGAVDLEVLKPLVERWIASLPGGGRVEPELDRGVRFAPGQVTRTWRLGTEPKAAVQLWIHNQAPWSRDAERDLRILSDVLNIRLREVLREDLGGVYGVSVTTVFERRPVERWLLSVGFGCAPDKVDALVAAIWAEGERIAKEGVSDDILGKLRQMAIRNREMQLTNNDTWATWLVMSARLGDEPTSILDAEPYLARLTSENVAAAARRYLARDNVFQAVLLPAQ